MHMHAQQDDIAIIQMVLQGRQQAFATLVARYQSYVFTIVLRHVSHRELAEELAQDVFVKAYNALPSFKGTSKFSTWLYTIAHNTCLSHLRKKESNTIFPGDEVIHAVTAQHAWVQPASRLEQHTQRQVLGEAISHLSETDSELITLFYTAEQSVEEISTITGLTESNVKVRLLRARQKLRDLLEKNYGKESIR